MKRILLLLIACTTLTVAQAQSPIGKGGTQLNFGVGSYYGYLPMYVGLDFGVHPDITIGPQVGFDLYLDYIVLNGRFDYHFNTIMDIPQDWDFYAGFNVGFLAFFEDDYRDRNRPNDRYRNHDTGVDLGLQVGGRYYWSDWGINVELGGGRYSTGARVGLSKRF